MFHKHMYIFKLFFVYIMVHVLLTKQEGSYLLFHGHQQSTIYSPFHSANIIYESKVCNDLDSRSF